MKNLAAPPDRKPVPDRATSSLDMADDRRL